MYFLGIDTSCYTTSVAIADAAGNILADKRVLLTVEAQERGLRQSEMVFQHIKNLSEIFPEGYTNIKNPLFIAGGPMMGNSLPTDEVIITKDVNCILVIEDHFEKNLPCIKCGKCMEVCPVGIYPVLIMETRDNLDKVKELKPEKCIECGLCSFTCPSKIEVREFVRIAKEKVNNK